MCGLRVPSSGTKTTCIVDVGTLEEVMAPVRAARSGQDAAIYLTAAHTRQRARTAPRRVLRLKGVTSIADRAVMRTGLAKVLDDLLFDVVPPILEPAGFKTVRSKRLWKRDDGRCAQAIAVYVDGRSARDGFLDIALEFGITYAFEADRAGPLIAGRGYVHQPERLMPDQSATPMWRFWEQQTAVHRNGDSYADYRFSNTYPGLLREQLTTYLTSVVVPAVDRFRDPRSFRDYLLSQGNLHEAIRLSIAVGDLALTRELIPAQASYFVRLAGYRRGRATAYIKDLLELAGAHGAQLQPDDEAFLRHAVLDDDSR
ncbi:MAG: hypothetical protein QOJ35_1412 [Solirubrobacteraceae bacterium]|nr:hypothetical protein [Solirubrobacteraceae bacterium]